MVGKLLEQFEHQIARLTLIPGTGGAFEVTADGNLVYSKRATGRHAEYDEVAQPLSELLG